MITPLTSGIKDEFTIPSVGVADAVNPVADQTGPIQKGNHLTPDRTV
ncbi:hypothetical protein [Spirosoma flavum]|uniref:Uncharacterized protein n=1 Tax=Spirosoma flavum TaxID=2048557 RepID=A0ABW6AKL8_9BACT